MPRQVRGFELGLVRTRGMTFTDASNETFVCPRCGECNLHWTNTIIHDGTRVEVRSGGVHMSMPPKELTDNPVFDPVYQDETLVMNFECEHCSGDGHDGEGNELPVHRQVKIQLCMHFHKGSMYVEWWHTPYEDGR